MKKSRYTAEQVAFALRQAESGTAVPAPARSLGLSKPTPTEPVCGPNMESWLLGSAEVLTRTSV